MLGRNSCTPRVPLMPEVGGDDLQGAGQVALHRELPGLRVADAEVGVDGEGAAAWSRSSWMKPLARVSGQAALFWTLRLLESGACCAICERDALVDGGVVVDAVAGADDQRGAGDGPPGDADAGLDAGAVGAHERGGIALPGRAACGALASTGATAVKPGATSRLTRRSLSSVTGAPYSQRTPALMVSSGLTRQSSMMKAS